MARARATIIPPRRRRVSNLAVSWPHAQAVVIVNPQGTNGTRGSPTRTVPTTGPHRQSPGSRAARSPVRMPYLQGMSCALRSLWRTSARALVPEARSTSCGARVNERVISASASYRRSVCRDEATLSNQGPLRGARLLATWAWLAGLTQLIRRWRWRATGIELNRSSDSRSGTFRR
jgi:hypothetical protein